jgi:hypothetical protein
MSSEEHVTQIFSFPSGDSAELADLTPEVQRELETLQLFHESKMSFNTLMSSSPRRWPSRCWTGSAADLVCLADGAEHPVGQRPEVGAVLLEALS